MNGRYQENASALHSINFGDAPIQLKADAQEPSPNRQAAACCTACITEKIPPQQYR